MHSLTKRLMKCDMTVTPKVVFDTQIYLRALINSHSACGRLLFEWDEHYQLYMCDEIEAEIVDVLTRSKVRKKFPQITDERIHDITSRIAILPRVHLTKEDIVAHCRDPKDDIFLACAKVAQTDYLVSEDNDLLVLFEHHHTKIINVASFLSILESKDEIPSTDES
jgi:putative PIN family toxin of toxin-antitoxin system